MSRFHVFHAQTRFRRYRRRRVTFSCFARSDSFSAVPRASVPVFMFCAPGLVFGGAEGVGARFHVSRARTRFGSAAGVGSRFHISRSRNCFRLSRVRRVSLSCFARPDSFSAVPGASGPVFTFCAPGLVFSGTEGIGSRFHVLRARTHLRRYRGRWVPFSCFARPYSFSAVPRALGHVFIFRAPGLIFDSPECVESRFHVLRARTHFRRYRGSRVPLHVSCARTLFWRYRGRRVPFSCFARPNLFSTLPSASSTVFMFCTSGLVFGGTEGVGFRFHVLRARTHFRGYRGRHVLF
jgi:hypothetical protein